MSCEASEQAKFCCLPTCSYLWLKSSNRGRKKEPVEQCGSRLQFKSLEVVHNGYYVCQACINQQGDFVESNEVNVNVVLPGETASMYMYVRMYIYVYTN